MEKKYQVFVSSTFRDLKNERQAVIRALLDLGHMPAGMELLPAADESAWHLIKSVIDDSDYYVLIIAGRYGSLDSEGLGFTEKEYDYAIENKKPVMAFLHDAPDSIRREDTDRDEAAWEKLVAFRSKVESSHHCSYWNGADKLHSQVVVALSALTKRLPAIGWIRADQLPVDFSPDQVLRLESRVRELEDELTRTRAEPPKGIEILSQGGDIHSISVKTRVLVELTEMVGLAEFKSATLEIPSTAVASWDEIFAAVAPTMINEASDDYVKECLCRFVAAGVEPSMPTIAMGRFGVRKVISVGETVVSGSELDTCIVQLRALGLIEESRKKRSLKDTETYWTLTSYGDSVMVKLRAIRRQS